MAPKGKGGDKGKGKAKGVEEEKGAGGKVKPSQFVNVRHILVCFAPARTRGKRAREVWGDRG